MNLLLRETNRDGFFWRVLMIWDFGMYDKILDEEKALAQEN